MWTGSTSSGKVLNPDTEKKEAESAGFCDRFCYQHGVVSQAGTGHVAFRSDLDRAWLCSSLLKPSATLQLKLHRATSKMLDIGQPAPRQVIEMSFPSSSKLWEFQDSAFSPFSASALSFAQTYSLRRQAFCFRDAEAVIRNRSGEAVWGLPCQFTSPV